MARSKLCASKFFILFFILLFSLCSLFGCVSGPKNDGRTFAEKMNSENYEATNVVIGVPILERKSVLRKFTGQVFCGDGIAQTPANRALVNLISGSQNTASASTDPAGRYVISTPINPENTYVLSATAACGSASKAVPKEIKDQPIEENFYLRK